MLHELRTYHATPGRMADLQRNFRERTCALFTKHGFAQLGYWTYRYGGSSDRLVYLLAWPDEAARDAAFAGFYADPEWQAARAEAAAAGPTVSAITADLLAPTDFSPQREPTAQASPPLLYELRTYHAMPGRMPDLQARFRDHTRHLFAKHGFTQIGYWTYKYGGESDRLVYMLAWPDEAARNATFAAFGADPEWQRARAASEERGTLVARITAELLAPTDFSPAP
jgi:hypothetical protein